MPVCLPSLEDAIAAVKTELDAIVGVGSVLTSFHTLEDDVEFIENGSYISAGSMDLWFVDLKGIDEIEGRAPGEIYERYRVGIRYWSIRTNDPDWSKKARIKAESVRDKLSGNTNVFAIGGQSQLITPETVQIVDHGQRSIRDHDTDQMVYWTELELAIEARRWGAGSLPGGAPAGDNVLLQGPTAGSDVLGVKVIGDPSRRWNVNADGSMEWGSGIASTDTFLRRSAVGNFEFGGVDGTSPHAIYIFKSRSESGFNREVLLVGAVSGNFYVESQSNGTGSPIPLHISGPAAVTVSGSHVSVYTRASGIGLEVDTTGHVWPSSDNAQDSGITANRWRDILWSRQLRSPAGTPALPPYSFSTESGFGLWRSTTRTLDLLSEAGECAFYVYNLTSASNVNYERGGLSWSSNAFFLTTSRAGTGVARNLNIQAAGNLALESIASTMTLRAGGATCVRMTGTAFQPDADNGRDWGSASLRWRDGFVSSSLRIGTNPAASGGVRLANNLAIVARNAANTADVNWGSVSASNEVILGGGNFLLILNPGTNGVVEQRSTTTAQTLRVYNTFTDTSNYERGHFYWTSNWLVIGTFNAGTGSARSVRFAVGNTQVWEITTGGNLFTNADNNYDIGTLDANRPRTGYFGTSVVIGTNPASAGAVRLANAGWISARNAADSADVDIVRVDSSNAISIGGGAVNVSLNAGSGMFTITSDITISDARNFIFNSSTGTKLGTATTQKLSFWNATPIVQPTGIADADGTLSDITTKFNSWLAKAESMGLLAVA